MPLTADIASFASGFSLERAPAELLPRAREALLDTLGVMLAGTQEEGPRLAAEWARSQGASGPSTVFALGGFGTAAEKAALANGVAAHAMDYDHFGHQSVAVLPCVLALGEALRSSGRGLLEGYIVGVEVATFLARGLGRESKEIELHPASISGALGAAAAASRLLGLGPAKTQVALGIAASLASGLSQNFGTMVKPLHIGNAARNGVMAAELSDHGFTANPEILDQEGGFFSELAPNDARDRLGVKYRFLEPGIAFKAYPCPYSSQRAVDAVIKVAESHDLKPEQVEEITCLAAPGSFRVLIHHRPSTSLEAKFSLEYLLAAGLAMRTIREESFGEAHVQDPSIRDLVELVHLVEVPGAAGAAEPAGEGPVTVEVRTREGEIYRETVSHAPGHPKNPLSWDRLAAKYRDCAEQAGLEETAIARSLELLARVGDEREIGELTGLLRLKGSKV